jgi:hypothetical protein
MPGQPDWLLVLISLPAISLEIIPSRGERHALTQGSFWMLDDVRVQVETVSAKLEITPGRIDQPLHAGLRAATPRRGLRPERTGPHRTCPGQRGRQLVRQPSATSLSVPVPRSYARISARHETHVTEGDEP